MEEETFFHLVQMEHGSHRAKLVTTYADADDAARQASLALNIQYMDGRTHHSMRTEASVTVFSTAILYGLTPLTWHRIKIWKIDCANGSYL